MKFKINTLFPFVAIASLFLSVTSCDKDDDPTPPTPTEDERIYKKAENPLGQTVKQWAEEWQKFTLSQSCDEAKTLSAFTIPGQDQLMLFLKGTELVQGNANINMQHGQSLFVPVVMAFYSTPTCSHYTYQIQSGQDPRNFLTATVGEILDGTREQFLKIDGTDVINLNSYQYQTDMLNLIPNSTLQNCSTVFKCFPEGNLQVMTKGYFVVIKPLPIGSHTITFHSKNILFNMEFTSTLNITVI